MYEIRGYLNRHLRLLRYFNLNTVLNILNSYRKLNEYQEQILNKAYHRSARVKLIINQLVWITI